MALIICPECGKEVSSVAKFCVHCGAPINNQLTQPASTPPAYTPPPYTPPTPAPQQQRTPWILYVAATFGALVLGMGICYFVINTFFDKDDSDKIVEEMTTPANVHYSSFSVNGLIHELTSNPAECQRLFTNQYVEVKGKLGGFDDSGEAFYIVPDDKTSERVDVLCFVPSSATRATLLSGATGDDIVAKGRIKSVNPQSGYRIEISDISITAAAKPEKTVSETVSTSSDDESTAYTMTYSDSDFFVQYGSYTTLEEARRNRPDQDICICKSRISGKGIWYRLLYGPYSTEEVANDKAYYIPKKTIVISGKHVRRDCITFLY